MNKTRSVTFTGIYCFYAVEIILNVFRSRNVQRKKIFKKYTRIGPNYVQATVFSRRIKKYTPITTFAKNTHGLAPFPISIPHVAAG